jgi:hypothetical protein
MMPLSNLIRRLLGSSLVCGVALSAAAQNPVFFQVDMSSQVGVTSVSVRGSFNDWNESPLQESDISGVYTGTVDIALSPGTVIACKFFYQPGDNWEGGADRQFVLAGGAQTLPLTAWNEKYPAPDNNITFQLDMTQQVKLGNFDPTTGYVRVSGGFNGWGESIDFTNNPVALDEATNIYSQTLAIPGFPGGQPGNYKFRAPIGDTWETIPDRPSFTLVGGDQTLPVVYWNNVAPFTPTNDVTFQVDMTAQILLGNWTPGQFIRVSGGMTGWGDGVDLTNNPALSGNATNVYSMVIPVVAETNSTISYKFRADFGDTWESPTSTGGGDRSFQVAGGPQVLPLVFYSDASPCDLLGQDTTVTFRLFITNGTTAIDGTVFDSATHQVVINGDFNNWNGGSWDITLPVMNPVIETPGLYEFQTVVTKGKAIAQKYKFGIYPHDGANADNEAPAFSDHIKYVRTYEDTFVMPIAQFGTNFNSTRVEEAFGGLQVGAPVGGNVPITWAGLPCVTLQTRTDLTSGTWTDLPETDAASATNWPNTGNAFFRLQKRSSP